MLYQRQSAISHKPVLLDVYLLVSIGICLMIGMVMVLSASMAVAHHAGLNPFYYFAKQFVYAALGIILGLGALYTPTKFWEELGPFWLLGGIILLLLVLVPGIGHVVNGSRRWIRLGPVALQVSELVKLCGIMYVSNYLVRQGAFAREHFIGVMKPIALLGLMAILLLMEPDFGATVVLFVSVLGVMFMAGVRLRWFSLLIGLGGVARHFIALSISAIDWLFTSLAKPIRHRLSINTSVNCLRPWGMVWCWVRGKPTKIVLFTRGAHRFYRRYFGRRVGLDWHFVCAGVIRHHGVAWFDDCQTSAFVRPVVCRLYRLWHHFLDGDAGAGEYRGQYRLAAN